MTSVLEEAKALEGDIIADRRWLHEHPEIGFDLPQTTAYVAERLREIGLEPEEIVPGGLVATIGDPSAGRCFMLRADMDALPIKEETGLPFASPTDYMHACGHDTHTAMLLGAARILKGREAELPGCVKLMFQPDEEGCAPDEICGNEAMINAGVLENPHVDAAAEALRDAAAHRLHALLEMRAGALVDGAQGAQQVHVVGNDVGGRAAVDGTERDDRLVVRVELARDEVLRAEEDMAGDVERVHQLVRARAVAALAVHDDVDVVDGREAGARARGDLAQAVVERHEVDGRGGVDVRFLRGVPSVYNDPDLTDELIGYVEDLTGRPVTILDKPISGSDDMSVISQAVPTTYFVMGTGSEDEGVRYPVHNSRVVFDESVFVEGAAMTATMALRWLEARARDDKENER